MGNVSDHTVASSPMCFSRGLLEFGEIKKNIGALKQNKETLVVFSRVYSSILETSSGKVSCVC